jgi:hypothetical protein
MLDLAFHSATFTPISATPSLPVLGFAFALSLLTGVLFGVVPAWLASRSDPAEALHGVGRGTRAGVSLPQKILVVSQAALSLVLLACAGLLTVSLRNLESQDFGFDVENRISIQIDRRALSRNRRWTGAVAECAERKPGRLWSAQRQ